MPTPKDLPKELKGLWKAQYESRERIILKKSTPKTRTMWRKLRYTRKMEIIDDFQSRGNFD